MRLSIGGEDAFVSTAHAAVDRDRPSVVFVHGAGMDHTVWLAYERYFAAAGYNALAVDLPGHGRSGAAPLTTIEAMSDWLIAVLAAAGVEQAAFVGHSMGSLIAYDCAARHPGCVTSGVLLGFALPMTVGPPLLEAARADDPAAIEMMVIFGHDFRSRLGGNPVAGVHVCNSARRLLARAKPGTLFADLNACNEYANEAAVEQIACPLVFASGARDRMTSPRVAAAVAGRARNATVYTIADSGHMVMAEQPEATHRILCSALVGGRS